MLPVVGYANHDSYQIGDAGNGLKDSVDLAKFGGVLVLRCELDNRGRRSMIFRMGLFIFSWCYQGLRKLLFTNE